MAFNPGPLIIFVAILVFGCNAEKQEKRIPTGKLIADHHLKKKEHWVGDSGLVFYDYENTNTGAYLLIGLNKKNDTILNYFGDCSRCFYNFYKFEGDYVLQINNAYKSPDYFGQYPELMPDQYFIDSMKYFKVDTITLAHYPVKRLANDSIIALAKKKYGLEGNYSMLHPALKNHFTLTKDTLNKSQVYYEVATEYQLKKNGDELILTPGFNSILPPTNLGVFTNKNTFHDYYNNCNSSPMNAASFCLYIRTFSKFTDTLKHYGLLRIIRNELVIKDNDHHEIQSILSVPTGEEFKLSSEKERELNAGEISDFRVDMFSVYGDYFITTFLPYEDEFMDSYPPLYQLDTLKWMLKPVLIFEKGHDKAGRSIAPHPRIYSENFKKRASNFFLSFEILKTVDGYRLAKKK